MGCPGMEAGILGQDLLSAMLNTRLPMCAANSQPADLSPEMTEGETSLSNTLRPSCGAPLFPPFS